MHKCYAAKQKTASDQKPPTGHQTSSTAGGAADDHALFSKALLKVDTR